MFTSLTGTCCVQLERDAGRYVYFRERLNFCPLGACALAGTGLPIDRFMTATALGFTQPMRNRFVPSLLLLCFLINPVSCCCLFIKSFLLQHRRSFRPRFRVGVSVCKFQHSYSSITAWRRVGTLGLRGVWFHDSK